MLVVAHVLNRFAGTVFVRSCWCSGIVFIIVVVMMKNMRLMFSDVLADESCISWPTTQQMDEVTLRGSCGLPRQ